MMGNTAKGGKSWSEKDAYLVGNTWPGNGRKHKEESG